jgi:hypothetical protein
MFYKAVTSLSIKGDVLDTRENTQKQTRLIPSNFLCHHFMPCCPFDRHAAIQRRAVSPSQCRLLENLHEVPVIKFLRSASSTAACCAFLTTSSMSSSSSTTSTTFDYIDSMSLLFPSFSGVNLMISYLLVY